jgi:hypothetical protein
VNKRFELIHLSEHTHPSYAVPVYLVQFAVNGQVSPYFWASKKDRVELGEDAWFENLKLEAEGALQQCGPSRALAN